MSKVLVYVLSYLVERIKYSKGLFSCSIQSLKKGKLWLKKVKLKRKSVKNAKNWAITHLNVPNGSQDIPFQSQEFEQDGCCHFIGFQPHFH